MSMMVLSDVVSLQDRGKYQGLLGANVGFGSVIGPFMAAGFIESATWRAHFWTVSPLAAVCGVVIIFLLPKGKVSAGAKEKLKLIDYWGVFFSTAATMLLLIPLSGGGSYFAWGSSMVISMMVLGGICLVIFMIIEWKFATLPMMPLHLFRNRAVASMLVANILFGAVYFSEVYFIPLYCQLVRGNTAIESAALTIPLSVGLSSASIVSGYIISHRGQYIDVLWFGFSLWTIALGLQILFDPKTNAAVIVVVLLIQGWGVGCIFQPTLVALQAHCSKADRAVVIAVRNYLRQFGGAAGLAMFSAIFANVLQNKLESSKDLPTSLAKSIGSNVFRTPDLSLLSPAEKKAVINAYAQGMRICFIIFVPILGICLLSCLFIKDTGLQRAEEKVEAASDTVPVAPLPQDIEKGTRSSPEKDENIDNGEKPKVSEMHKLGSNRISSEETLASRPQPSI
ncbi:putative mfs multidrug transporter [Phaeomoniella chlamydospora]|uniref:Putative mfs multidrug transporter n=1 Tax=Phaeomoniella chlamydospora TaxID=158046 RepID=A0A0G2G167_PHACM|nr:putative mfs multidrug transporter [Phaeomoniella chlamydospora]